MPCIRDDDPMKAFVPSIQGKYLALERSLNSESFMMIIFRDSDDAVTFPSD